MYMLRATFNVADPGPISASENRNSVVLTPYDADPDERGGIRVEIMAVCKVSANWSRICWSVKGVLYLWNIFGVIGKRY